MRPSDIFATRSVKDQEDILKVARVSAHRVAGKVRARVIEAFRRGEHYQTKPYILQQLRPMLTLIMLAGHLAGYRRFHLVRRQVPAIKKRLEALELSALSDALRVLQTKTQLDINALQKQYDTLALRVLNNVSDDVDRALQDEVTDLIAEGAHAREAIERLGKKFDDLGLTPKNDFQLETIFRTQVQLTFGAGKYQAEQDPDIQEILWGYQYVTVGDDRVRPEHEVLDGVTLPKDDPFWQRFYPPNGWNCRCQAIPIFEQVKEVKPKLYNDDGSSVTPDKGFDFNPGQVFKTLALSLGASNNKIFDDKIVRYLLGV